MNGHCTMNELKSFIHVELICRGSGKTFFLIRGKFDTDLYNLRLTTISNSFIIPCNLLRISDYEQEANPQLFVVVTPQISPSITLNFSLVDRDKNPVANMSKSFNEQEIKWKSRFAYHTKPDIAAKIRNYDEERDASYAAFDILEYIPNNDSLIIHGSLRIPSEITNPISVSAFSNTGELISSDYVEMGSSEITLTSNSNIKYLSINFSLQIKIADFFYLAASNAKTSTFLPGFRAYEKDEVESLRKNGDLYTHNAQVDDSYYDWFLKHKATPIQLNEQRHVIFANQPTFSIVVPLYETPIDFFKEMTESVISQSYEKWELILVNASPANKALKDTARHYTLKDKRIRYIELKENLGISLNTAEGIKQATGDFVCFFDHDDLIEPNLLFHYTCAINSNQNIDVLYCDEDKLLPDGHYAQPFFKPNFSIDLLRNNNYICHMLTIRKEILDSIPITTNEFDGAQDHNLTLRASEITKNFFHVPQVLYHWRMNDNSTAANADNKPYATQAGIKAVHNHLNRLNIDASVKQSRRPFTYDVTYKIKGDPLVSIIIPTKDHINFLETCISSIISKSTYSNYEIVLVENNSVKQETFTYYKMLSEKYKQVKIVTWENEFNFSKIINFGVKHSAGDYLLLLNNDTEVITDNWIELMLGHAQRSEVGAVGVRLYYKDNTIQHAGLCVTGTVAGHLNRALPKGAYGYFALSDATQNLSAVTAACLMSSKKDFEKVNGFTEELTVAFNDVDYCLKLRENNKLIVYTPEVELYHYESISRGQEDTDDKKLRFHKEVSYMNKVWAKYYVQGDPYINPNFDMSEPYNRYYRLPHFD